MLSKSTEIAHGTQPNVLICIRYIFIAHSWMDAKGEVENHPALLSDPIRTEALDFLRPPACLPF